MPRGIYNRKKKASKGGSAVPAPAQEAVELAHPAPVSIKEAGEALKTFSFFKGLNESEQKVVETESTELLHAMSGFGNARIAIGEHLSRIKDVLTPHNVYGRYFAAARKLGLFTMNIRTADRYVAGYRNAKALLPKPIVNLALERGVNIIGDTEQKPFGQYTDAVRQLPPPTKPTEEQARVWLNQVEDVRKKSRAVAGFSIVPQDPGTLLQQCYRFVALRYKKLPHTKRVRDNWVRSLMGMLATEFSVTAVYQTAIPEEFRTQRGRPRTVGATAVQ